MNKNTISRIAAFAVLPLILLGAHADAQDLSGLDQWGTQMADQSVPLSADVQDIIENSGFFSPENGGSPVGNSYGNWTRVDPTQLSLQGATTASAFLVGDSASFLNTYGISIGEDYALETGDEQLLFRPADAPSQFVDPALEVSDGPLMNGRLDLFLAVNEGDGNATGDLYWTDPSVNTAVTGFDVNPDGLQHAVAFLHNTGAGGIDYVLYGWEDLEINAQTNDFNDHFILFGSDGLTVVPEHSTYLMLGATLLFAGAVRRKKKRLA
jgi:hypothetical protein